MKKRQQRSSNNQDEEIYCICRSSDTSRFMICCDECNEWFHGDCIDITQEEANDIEQFYCERCLDKHPNLKIIYVKKKFKLEKSKKEYDKDRDLDMEKEREQENDDIRNNRTSRKCGECKSCRKTTDCAKCDYCKDMKKYGGPNRIRQKCRERQCLNLGVHSIRKKHRQHEHQAGRDVDDTSRSNMDTSTNQSYSSSVDPYDGSDSNHVMEDCDVEEEIVESGFENDSTNQDGRGGVAGGGSPKVSSSYVTSETFYEKDSSRSEFGSEVAKKPKKEETIKREPSSSPSDSDVPAVGTGSSPEDDTSQDPDFEQDLPSKSQTKMDIKSSKLKHSISSHLAEAYKSDEARDLTAVPEGVPNAKGHYVTRKRKKRLDQLKRRGSRRGSSRSKASLPSNRTSIHCHGPKCIKASRPGSKYCSDECGLKLATKRIFEFLPMRIQQWQNNPSVTDLKNKAHWERVRIKQLECQRKLEELKEKKDQLENLIRKAKLSTIDNEQDNQESEVEDIDASIFCITCGHPIHPKTAARHMDKCFAKFESQTSYGSVYQTNVGTDLFCDTYNSDSQTYCKRLKVLCPEHTKEPKVDENEVCGFPLIKNVFEETGQFCRASKKKCMKHYSWDKYRRAEIDMEKVRQLLILDDLFDEERQIRMILSNRAGVLGLILHQTISHHAPTYHHVPPQPPSLYTDGPPPSSTSTNSNNNNNNNNVTATNINNKDSGSHRRTYSFNDEYKKSLLQREQAIPGESAFQRHMVGKS